MYFLQELPWFPLILETYKGSFPTCLSVYLWWLYFQSKSTQATYVFANTLVKNWKSPSVQYYEQETAEDG